MAIKDYLFTTTSAFIFFFVFVLFISGILIYYVQTKIKEQNHKLDSMFSLVTTIAQQLTDTKQTSENPIKILNEEKICVSDDDLSFNDSESESTDNEVTCDDDSCSDDDDDDNDDDETTNDDNIDHQKWKSPLKCNSPEKKINDDESVSTDGAFDIDIGTYNDDDIPCDDITCDDNHDTPILENLSNSENTENIKHVIIDDSILQNVTDGISNIKITDINFKTINISNLEEDVNSNKNIDYKKMNIQKLKSIVQEKGLINDSSKLKKQELLKLLGCD